MFIDADTESLTYNQILRFYSPYAGFAVYKDWIFKDPNTLNINGYKIGEIWTKGIPTLDKCMNVKKTDTCKVKKVDNAKMSFMGVGNKVY